MALINRHLNAIPDGNNEAEVVIDFTTYVPGSGGSDNIAEGNYELTIFKAVHVAKKDGSGDRNAKFIFKVSAPKCGEFGKQMVQTHPIQVGDPASPENARKNFLPAMVYSTASGQGTAAAEKLKTVGQVTKPLKWFEGRKVWARVTHDDNTKGRIVGKVHYYITKEEFDMSPGPVGGGNGAPQAAAPQAAAPQAAEADPLDFLNI